LSEKAQPKQQIKPGAIIRVLPSDGRWILAQMPQVLKERGAKNNYEMIKNLLR
jgi:hypothetical protein